MSKRARLSYAGARRWLGVGNLGFWVGLASVGLICNLAGVFFPTEPVSLQGLAAPLGLFLGGCVLLQAPFDWLGEYLLPTLYQNTAGDFSDHFVSWLRGVAVQVPLLGAIATAYLFLTDWAIWLLVGWMAVLLLCQLPLARLAGRFQTRGTNGWKSADPAFTGGIGGFPGLQKAIFANGRGQRLRALDEYRRHALQEMRLPVAGIVLAVTFNLLGLLLASQCLRFPLNTVAGLVELVLWFTLWSFLGLLLLPSLSRPAVYAGDYALFAKGIEEEAFADYLRYDFLQAGEESRFPWADRLFYSVPSPAQRLACWRRPPGWSGGWQAAHYALYLSWAGLSLLHRAVPCNIGKPNVWVLLPCD